MKQETRQALKKTISAFIQRQSRKVANLSLEDLRRAYPFQDLFFRDEAMYAFKLQRSVVTSMGADLVPEVAAIIAKDKYREVHVGKGKRGHPVSGQLPANKCNKIEEIVTSLRNKSRSPDRKQEVDEITAQSGGGKRPVTVMADLYIADFYPGVLFVEIKSPWSNLDVFAESKRKLLYFLAIAEELHQVGAEAYLALYYNPFFPNPYHWWACNQVMDIDCDVLIASDFWDKIGGKGTYEELLDVLAEAKKETPLQPQQRGLL